MQNQIRILLIEDDLAHAEIVQRNLERYQDAYQIMHIEDGQTALDYLNHYNQHSKHPSLPDIILLDLRLPRIAGIEVLHQIKTNGQLQHIPIVILTTSDAETDIRSAYRYGAHSYLVKPVNFEEFSQVIEAFGNYWINWNYYAHRLTE